MPFRERGRESLYVSVGVVCVCVCVRERVDRQTVMWRIYLSQLGDKLLGEGVVKQAGICRVL